MKLEDFNGSDFECYGERELADSIICGEHYPKIQTYRNIHTDEWYQVSAKGKAFRKTPSAGTNKVVSFGDWEYFE